MTDEITGALYGYAAGALMGGVIDAAFSKMLPESDPDQSILDLLVDVTLEIGLLGVMAFPAANVLAELATSDTMQAASSMFFMIGLQPQLENLVRDTNKLGQRLFNALGNRISNMGSLASH